MILPQQAAIRPRVRIANIGNSLLLEDEVRERLDGGQRGLIVLIGPPGSGKSSALAHLAVVVGDDPRLRLADEPDNAQILALMAKTGTSLVVCTDADLADYGTSAEAWHLLQWSLDEQVEYLLHAWHDQCPSVIQRLKADGETQLLSGSPELWSIVLDQMAQNDSLTSVREVLSTHIHSRLSTSGADLIRQYSFAMMLGRDEKEMDFRLRDLSRLDRKTLSLVRHEFVWMHFAAELVAECLKRQQSKVLQESLPQSLIEGVSKLVRTDLSIQSWLTKIMTSPELSAHSMAASILHATGASWRPGPEGRQCLNSAYLSGIKWSELRLKSLDVAKADLCYAELTNAQIDGFIASDAQLSGANLHGAGFQLLSAADCSLVGADLSFVRAGRANFRRADLRFANLEGALLRKADFLAAELSGARLCRANLAEAILIDAHIDDADFSGTNLHSAKMAGLALRTATFNGANLSAADLQNCDLEYMTLAGGNFIGANLSRAHLTGSQMPRANFRRANLTNTGLAEIDWEGADLRDADLRGSTFHLGSSRSGLIDSPIASEGSRTGFYTDELYEQDFKSPEEIRKANLCRADLHGAKIDKVDFYLVDLRGAKYSRQQEQHFRDCGAILETRV